MKIKELAEKYCFHDSLLESIEYDEQKKTATFNVDFCNWAQENYTDDAPETAMIQLCFKGVDYIANHCVHIESNGISGCRATIKTMESPLNLPCCATTQMAMEALT